MVYDGNPIEMDDLGVPLFSETSISLLRKIRWLFFFPLNEKSSRISVGWNLFTQKKHADLHFGCFRHADLHVVVQKKVRNRPSCDHAKALHMTCFLGKQAFFPMRLACDEATVNGAT